MPEKVTILIVDRSPGNRRLLQDFLTREGYDVRQAGGLEEFEAVVREERNLKLALVDIAGFGKNIWDHCELLREKGIPFLVISPPQPVAATEGIYAYGAGGVLTKPLSARQLLSVVRSLIAEGT